VSRLLAVDVDLAGRVVDETIGANEREVRDSRTGGPLYYN
jgi:hypothetical protein